jgi:hypothetical protein
VGNTNIQNSTNPVPSTYKKNASCDEYVKWMCKPVNLAVRQLATLVKKKVVV